MSQYIPETPSGFLLLCFSTAPNFQAHNHNNSLEILERLQHCSLLPQFDEDNYQPKRYHLWNFDDQTTLPLNQPMFKLKSTIIPNLMGHYDVFAYLMVIRKSLTTFVDWKLGFVSTGEKFLISHPNVLSDQNPVLSELDFCTNYKNYQNRYRAYLTKVVCYQLKSYFEINEYGSQYISFARKFWTVWVQSNKKNSMIINLPRNYARAHNIG